MANSQNKSKVVTAAPVYETLCLQSCPCETGTLYHLLPDHLDVLDLKINHPAHELVQPLLLVTVARQHGIGFCVVGPAIFSSLELNPGCQASAQPSGTGKRPSPLSFQFMSQQKIMLL
jgi:hypothetical protein